MRHDVTRPNRDKVAAPHHRIRSEPVGMASGDLLNERETHNNYRMSFSV